MRQTLGVKELVSRNRHYPEPLSGPCLLRPRYKMLLVRLSLKKRRAAIERRVVSDNCVIRGSDRRDVCELRRINLHIREAL